MISADGCPVEAYARMPADPEVSVVRRFATGRGSVLDLGAGAGRIADPLTMDGHAVLAVDESQEMLDHVEGASTLRSTIEDLDIAERFDLVLLMSHLINDPDSERRSVMLRVAERHLSPSGIFLIQRHDPSRTFEPGFGHVGDVEIGLCDIVTDDWPFVSAVTHYRVDETTWSQPWEARLLDDLETVEALSAAGLSATFLDGPWVVAARSATTEGLQSQ